MAESKEEPKEELNSPEGFVSLPQAIVLSSLMFSGVGIVITIAVTKVDWFYPVLAYMMAVYFVWQHSLSDKKKDDGGYQFEGKITFPPKPKDPGDAASKQEEATVAGGLTRAIPVPKRLKLD